MKTPKYCAPVAIMILIILAILLTACGPTPEYGIIASLTPAPTVTPTPLPSAQAAAIKFMRTMTTLDSTEKILVYQERLCSLASSSGCSFLKSETIKSIKYQYDHYKIKTDADIESATMIGDGVYSSGTPWQVWEVSARYNHPWPGLRTNNPRPQIIFVWTGGEWKYDGVSMMANAISAKKP